MQRQKIMLAIKPVMKRNENTVVYVCLQRDVKNAGGMTVLERLLRTTNDVDTCELVTGILWNLSSAQVCRRSSISDALIRSCKIVNLVGMWYEFHVQILSDADANLLHDQNYQLSAIQLKLLKIKQLRTN